MQPKLMFNLIASTLLALARADAADLYKIDPVHSSITFSIRHLGINNVKGRFKEYEGAISLDNGTITEANGTIQVKSVDTGVQKRDEHLLTADFFDAANYPTITFKSKRVEGSGDQLVLFADFTMHGVTRELRLPVKLSGPIKDPRGTVRIGLEAKTQLNRKDYGIKYHQLLETGALALGEEVALEINAEAIKETPGQSK
jgi:polyisoprenoid-binding protein YceI